MQVALCNPSSWHAMIREQDSTWPHYVVHPRHAPQLFCTVDMLAGQLTGAEVRGWLHCRVILPLKWKVLLLMLLTTGCRLLSICVCAQEAAACQTIAQRGVLLVSTAHGNSLGDLLRNPDLQGLIGGIKAVTLGDRLAHDKNGGHKVSLACWCGALVVVVKLRGSDLYDTCQLGRCLPCSPETCIAVVVPVCMAGSTVAPDIAASGL